MHRSREWLYEWIRRDKRQNPETPGRAWAPKYRVSRNTMAKALRLEDFEFEADAAERLSGVIARCSKADLLRLDAFGHLSLAEKGAKPLFQVFAEREEHKVTAMASKAPPGGGGKTFIDLRLCAAIAERPAFEGSLIQTGTVSYRLKAAENEYRSARRS
ncbi:ATP-binding protein [Streptomyces cinnamoneus]|uniref:ATP-binding protein n=1 Tax=Streptomyces cinnamoneus TaxID=53446 RepID=UPI0033F11763